VESWNRGGASAASFPPWNQLTGALASYYQHCSAQNLRDQVVSMRLVMHQYDNVQTAFSLHAIEPSLLGGTGNGKLRRKLVEVLSVLLPENKISSRHVVASCPSLCDAFLLAAACKFCSRCKRTNNYIFVGKLFHSSLTYSEVHRK